MYTCIYIYIYMCIYMYMIVYIYMWLYIYIYDCIYIWLYIHMCDCIYIYISYIYIMYILYVYTVHVNLCYTHTLSKIVIHLLGTCWVLKHPTVVGMFLELKLCIHGSGTLSLAAVKQIKGGSIMGESSTATKALNHPKHILSWFHEIFESYFFSSLLVTTSPWSISAHHFIDISTYSCYVYGIKPVHSTCSSHQYYIAADVSHILSGDILFNITIWWILYLLHALYFVYIPVFIGSGLAHYNIPQVNANKWCETCLIKTIHIQTLISSVFFCCPTLLRRHVKSGSKA